MSHAQSCAMSPHSSHILSRASSSTGTVAGVDRAPSREDKDSHKSWSEKQRAWKRERERPSMPEECGREEQV